MSQPDAPPAQPDKQLTKQYAPEEHEGRIWQRWLDARAFAADPNRVLSGEADPYCVLIPPPNVTAALHLGHALNNTIQDVLVRAHRMKGFETLWMPGTDHAGIATQTVVDRRLKAEDKPALAEHKQMEREGQNGREKFTEQVQAFKDEYEQRITEQLMAMGCSCDYDRQRFTMDEVCARAVREAFFQLFKAGLIYRGKRLVNWDPVTQTALADDEVDNVEVDGAFYYLRYPLVHPSETSDHTTELQPVTWDELAARGYPGAGQHPDDEQAWITVATTRPETYLGDTAVAVNPKDPRAESLKGLRCDLPLVGRRIPIIEDDYVVLPVALGGDEHDAKAQMATGFLKVTPAHDPNDWLIGQRHDLPIINVMAPDATISADYGWDDYDPHAGAEVFVGLSREDARKKVIEEFKARSVGEGSLLEQIKPHRHTVGHSYRSHAAIEPYLSDQWYCKVTDDRLRGTAQRALKPEQRTDASLNAWPESTPACGTGVPPAATDPTSPRGTGVPPVTTPSTPSLSTRERNLPHWELGESTYHITFRLAEGTLTEAERQLVLNACFHFHDDRHITRLTCVMPDHVHLLLMPLKKGDDWWPLQELLHSIKSYTAHEILKSRGSSGPLWQDEYYDRIVRDLAEYEETFRYIQHNPVEAGLARKPGDYRFTRRAEEVEQSSHGRDARATSSGSSDGKLTFHPARYAKTYETWHDNLRDWCISRQLWWGHRIPVWTGTMVADVEVLDPFESKLATLLDQDRIALGTTFDEDAEGWAITSEGKPAATTTFAIAVRDSSDKKAIEVIEEFGFTQDPDVLDTWFSSALWPLSTMGWPDADAAAKATSTDDFASLLPAFNPTSVLCTAREIITLWVSRMVMFNRYFLSNDSCGTGVPPVTTDPSSSRGTGVPPVATSPSQHSTAGQLPFKDVFIHAMIQDGEGRKMSKSLGNGVDPLDIIHTHGADAMRFTLVQMTTQTQDVRMPVEPDPETGKNTSPKFDVGRNFANKLWNAARFAISMLERDPASDQAGSPDLPISLEELSLPDRWMLSRLARATTAINAALRDYQFKDYADALYDLLWRDFCDWYLEAIKPTVATDPNQRAVLRLSLDAILRLAHPVMPFITEAVYERLRTMPMREIEGLSFAATKAGTTLCQSGWPEPGAGVRDEPAEEAFERVRTLVESIRQVRAARQVSPKRRITLHASGALAKDIARWAPLVETLSGLAGVTTDAAESTAAPFTFEGAEHHLSDLADAADAGAERDRLTKELADLDKSIKALEGRLSNPGYTEKAPPQLVQQTRDELAAKQADRETVKSALDKLA